MKELQVATDLEAERSLAAYFKGVDKELVCEAVPFTENLQDRARGVLSNEDLEAGPVEEAERSPTARARLLAMQDNNVITALGHQLLYAVLEQPLNFSSSLHRRQKRQLN